MRLAMLTGATILAATACTIAVLAVGIVMLGLVRPALVGVGAFAGSCVLTALSLRRLMSTGLALIDSEDPDGPEQWL